MKIWKNYILAISLMLVCLMPLSANAEERKDEWKQAGYAFAPMRLVLVRTEFGEKVQADDLKQRILLDKLSGAFLSNSRLQEAGFSFVSQDELKNYQAILEVRLSNYYDTSRLIPEHIETYTTTKQVHINKTVTATNGSRVTIDE